MHILSVRQYIVTYTLTFQNVNTIIAVDNIT